MNIQEMGIKSIDSGVNLRQVNGIKSQLYWILFKYNCITFYSITNGFEPVYFALNISGC